MQKLGWVFVVLVTLITGVFAQAPAPPAPAAASAPALDVDETLTLQTLQTLGEAATADCQALDSVKKYQELRGKILARLEARHPGYTLGPAGTLVAKPAAPAK